ncbi:BufA1 family periplasmic bufferin-type metallophore [Opacimonas viscosa]|uniref:DUF2282 domain-containing protein n=1 Tax=Opacimonas viscosa TaxID=2961944 RepID=A0AA42BLL8_9ALTE|nr:DUF2282 domain-containing protein [Opacimonas viscosa]MCP3428993.1 DUF2282 domain-containing protein [Opacimonas viscosa]
MKQSTTLSLAVASLLTLGVAADAQAMSKKGKEKCYGVALAGQNDCGNLAGTHSCAGQSKVDNDIGEWKLVPKGTCKDLNGYSRKEAKAMYKSLKAEAGAAKDKMKSMSSMK